MNRIYIAYCIFTVLTMSCNGKLAENNRPGDNGDANILIDTSTITTEHFPESSDSIEAVILPVLTSSHLSDSAVNYTKSHYYRESAQNKLWSAKDPILILE